MKKLIVLAAVLYGLLLSAPLYAQITETDGFCSAPVGEAVYEWPCTVVEPEPEPEPEPLVFTAEPNPVQRGEPVTLTWSGPGDCTLRAFGQTIAVLPSDSLSFVLPQTVTAVFACGDLATELLITVVDQPPEPEPQPDPTPDPGPPPEGWPAEVPAPFSFGDDLDPCPAITHDDPDWYLLEGSNCVAEGFTLTGAGFRVRGQNIVVRDFEVNGNGVSDKVGVSIGGSNIVILRGKSHHLLGNDKHCYMPIRGSRNIWLIESEGYYCSGDGFQAGHQAEGNRPTNIFLVRNRFHETRENGIDLKYTANVIAVENELYGFQSAPEGPYCLPDMPNRCSPQNSGSDGSAVIIGSDGGPQGWALYRNVIHDSSNCIRVEEAETAGTIADNECRDIAERALQLDKRSGRIAFTGNTIERAGRGIFQNHRDQFELDVADNVFRDITGPAIEYEQRAVFEASTLTDNAFIRSGPVIYNNDTATTEAQINSLPGASGNTVN